MFALGISKWTHKSTSQDIQSEVVFQGLLAPLLANLLFWTSPTCSQQLLPIPKHTRIAEP
jgi:hypothetical protein